MQHGHIAQTTCGTSFAMTNLVSSHAHPYPSKYDSPSYTLRAFIPAQALDAYLSLRTLNIDLSLIADSTSAATIGALRMQFWRDSVARALSSTPPKEPVAVLLSSAASSLSSRTDGKSHFSKSWLNRIINTREQYLHNPPYVDMAALESYAENTYSTLLYLTLSALPLPSLTADHLASHIGKAQGIAAVLRGLPLLAFPPPPNHHSNRQGLGGAAGQFAPTSSRQGTVTLPLDIMASAGLREEEVLRKGAAATGLRDAVFSVATRANDHLITAREMLRNVRAGRDVGHDFEHGDDAEHARYEVGQTRQTQAAEVERGFGVLMPAVATQMWLDRLQKADFDVFEPSLRRSDWRLPWKAYWAYTRRKL